MIDVLIVDDDFRVARIHRGFVERLEDFRVVATASTGEEAIAAVEQLRPDLVLLDLYLPDMFGLDVVARLHTAGHDCDVLVISAARESDNVRRAVRYGAVNYLLKPFSFEELRGRLEQYAARRSTLSKSMVCDQGDIDRALTSSSPITGSSALPAASAQRLPDWWRRSSGSKREPSPPPSVRIRSASPESVPAVTSNTSPQSAGPQ